ncbi:MAG: TIGR00730 family Rossman fold protein [Betaproteobacteria bacterium]|nr:MAG: TIGR00730 family Rossman fold protein [Betaproteobacteria bacterium]
MKRNRPAYRLADRDVEFLNHDDTRGVRLELEYLKAELLLRKHHVEHTVLVMGSTRVRETDPYYRIARELGRIVGRSRCAAIMTGGGPGIMEAANRGAFEVGAPSIGLNIDLPREQKPNRYITPDLCLRFRYFALRKLHFLLRARAFVAFPGGYGTFDELFETLTLVQCRKIAPLPIVLVGEAYWRRAVDFDFLLAQRKIGARDVKLFRYAETAREIWNEIRRYQT